MVKIELVFSELEEALIVWNLIGGTLTRCDQEYIVGI